MKFRYILANRSVLITSSVGFDIAFTKVKATLKQRRNKVVSTLF